MICTAHPILFGDKIEKNEMGGSCSAYGGEERKNMRERDHSGNPGVDGRIILRWIFRKRDVRAWTRLIWFRIGTDDEHL